MVKPEEKSLTAPLPLASQSAGGVRRPLHHHNPAVRKAIAARTAAGPPGAGAGQLPIVRAQIRLPNDQLSEKSLAGEGGGSSGPATPVLGRKIELAASSSKTGTDKRVPKSVASMVRRYVCSMYEYNVPFLFLFFQGIFSCMYSSRTMECTP